MTSKFASGRPLTAEEENEIQQMIASDPDAPELTDEQLSNGKSFAEAFPQLAASARRELAKRGRPKADETKTPVTIRLDPDLVRHYKTYGKGWQTRLNDDLRKLAGL